MSIHQFIDERTVSNCSAQIILHRYYNKYCTWKCTGCLVSSVMTKYDVISQCEKTKSWNKISVSLDPLFSRQFEFEKFIKCTWREDNSMRKNKRGIRFLSKSSFFFFFFRENPPVNNSSLVFLELARLLDKLFYDLSRIIYFVVHYINYTDTYLIIIN